MREFASESPIPVIVVGGNHVGLRRNMERAIETCTGNVIALADQDDVWMPGKVAAIREAFEDPAVTLWFSDADLMYESGELMGERLWERVNFAPERLASHSHVDTLRRFLVGQTVTGATMAIRGSLTAQILPFPDQLESTDHLFLHDGWMAVLAWLTGTPIADPQRWIRYRRHPRQFTATPEPAPGRSTDPVAPSDERRRTRDRLVAHRDLAREYQRVRLVLERVRATQQLTAYRPADVETLAELEAFLRVRTPPRGVSRGWSILGQLVRSRYSRYARGWRTAAADLFLSRDHARPADPGR